MARLVYEITGDISGLESAINQASNLIKDAGAKSSQINITIPDISPQIKAGVAALDQLDQKLSVITGNATLFGDSVKLQTQEVGAYQTAINSLLANGFDPMDGDVQRLKQHVDDLSASLKNVKNVQPPGSFENVTSTLPSAENVANPNLTGAVAQESELIAALNQQLAAGTITLQEYNQAILSANSSSGQLAQTLENTSNAVVQEDGYINGLKRSLAELNALRLKAPAEDLAVINSEAQQIELSLQQALNVGKIGADSLGNSIKGISVSNVNGQLVALSNNLFGARQISRDLVRTFDSTSVGTFARSIGLLAVDFLFFAQNAQFAGGATKTATTAIAVEGEVAAGSALSTGALGAAFASLLTPTSLIVLGIAAAGAGLIAYENSQKNATKSATEHIKALREQKQALDDYLSTLSESQKVQSAAAAEIANSVNELNSFVNAINNNKDSIQGETEAFENLQGKFPEYFAGITQSQIGTQAFTDAISKAIDGLKNLALANAAFKLSGDAAVSQIANQVALDDSVQKALAAYKQLEAARKQVANTPSVSLGTGGSSGQGAAAILESLEKAYAAANDQVFKYSAAVNGASAQQDKFNKLAAQYQKQTTANQQPDNRIGFLQNEISQLEKILPKAQNYQEVLAKIKADQAELDVLLGKGGGVSSADPYIAIGNSLTEIINKIGALANDSGLVGYALKVQKINDNYIKINESLSIQAQKLAALADKPRTPKQQKEFDADKSGLNTGENNSALAQQKELSDASIEEAQKTDDAIQKINDQFGIKQQAGYNEELSRIKRLYDNIIAESKKFGDTQAELRIKAAADAAFPQAIQAADAKYIEQETETYGKIVDIANEAFQLLDNGEQARTDKIILEGQRRITQAQADFNKLRDIATGAKAPQATFDQLTAVEKQVTDVINLSIKAQVSEVISKPFADALQGAVQGFVSNFYTSLTTLGAQRQTIDDKYSQQLQQQQIDYANSVAAGDGKITAAQNESTINQINNLKKLEEQSTTSFEAIFSSLVTKFQSTFNESILNSFTKQFTESLGKRLLTPTAKQLTISPDQQAAQQLAATLKSASGDLGTQIKQAGDDFAAKVTQAAVSVANSFAGIVSPGLLSGASGGSALGAVDTTAEGVVTQQSTFNTGVIATADKFGENIDAAGGSFADQAVAASRLSQQIQTTGATTSSNKLSTAAAGLAAAASLAGSIVSGLGKPTNTATSALGGALTGAGEGALVGTALGGPIIGTAIGAVVGAIGGIFSASKAKKQEELQQQQLEQQQETNELLARQNALAYTTSIIGRMTQQGIVTGVDLNSFGQLTATVSGKNIQFVLDRAANGR